MRQPYGMRRPISSKSDTCTERMEVDAAGISVKEGAQYPGRSAGLPCATTVERRWEGTAEVSRSHSSSATTSEGLNFEMRNGARGVTVTGDIGGRAETHCAHSEGRGRNPREKE